MTTAYTFRGCIGTRAGAAVTSSERQVSGVLLRTLEDSFGREYPFTAGERGRSAASTENPSVDWRVKSAQQSLVARNREWLLAARAAAHPLSMTGRPQS